MVTTAELLARAVLQKARPSSAASRACPRLGVLEKDAREAAQLLAVRDRCRQRSRRWRSLAVLVKEHAPLPDAAVGQP
jgi:hypothetical protein